jgi:2-phosphosulfolactate phosphatase
MHVEVAFLPRDATRLPERVALVIDVIRATTTLITLFECGARSVALANNVLSARSAATVTKSTDRRAGLPPEDFGYGNSPVALLNLDLQQRSISFSTTDRGSFF